MDRAIVLKFARPAKVPELVKGKLVGMRSPVSDEVLLSALERQVLPVFQRHFPNTEILIEVSNTSKHLIRGFAGPDEKQARESIPMLLESVMEEFNPAEE